MLLLVFLYPFGVQLNVVQNATGPAPHFSSSAPNFLKNSVMTKFAEFPLHALR